MDFTSKKSAPDCFHRNIGVSLSAVYWLQKEVELMAQERRIPFEITADPDPFYCESNIRYLGKKMEDYKAGRLKLMEHELIEEEGEFERILESSY